MAENKLTLSDDGIAKLKDHEGVIDGLYDDSSEYCTFGVGHLVHPKDKWKCFLLETAKSDDTWKAKVLKQNPGTSDVYLPRATAFDDKFDDLKAKAIENTKLAIAEKKYAKEFDKLAKGDQEKVTAEAKDVVDEQAKLLAKVPNDVFSDDLKPYEKAVNDTITVKLAQEEFDSLVSFCFNIGIPNFTSSTNSVVAEINKDKYKSGEAKDRNAAIQAIETAFGKWNKSKGAVNAGLTKRRKAEADCFLAAARSEVAELEKKANTAPGSPASIGAPKPVGGQPPVKK